MEPHSLPASPFAGTAHSEPGDFTSTNSLVSDGDSESARDLRRRVAIEQFLSALSTRFINTHSEDVDSEIQRGLESLGRFLQADRTYVFLIIDDQLTMRNTHEWCGEGVESVMDLVHVVRPEQQPWIVGRLRRSEILDVPSVADLPPEAAAEKKLLLRQRIKSVLAVPVAHERELYGLVGADYVREERTFDDEMVRLLRLVGEIFANALARKTAGEELQRTYNFLELTIANLERRDTIMKAVYFAAECFLRQSDWRSTVRHVLERLGEVPGVAFITIFERIEKLDEVEISAFWCANPAVDTARQPLINHHVPISVFPAAWKVNWMSGEETRHRASTCPIANFLQITPEEDFQGIDIPFFCGADWKGFMRFGSRQHERAWSEPEVDALKSVTGLFGAALQRELHEMERKSQEESLWQSERIAAIGRLAGGIAHDFNNLLTVVVGYGDLLLEAADENDVWRGYAKEILEASTKAHQLTRQLLTFSRSQPIRQQNLRLGMLVQKMLQMLQRLIREEIVLKYASQTAVDAIYADPGQIEQVLMNLVVNARDAINGQGSISIEITHESIARARIAIGDDIVPADYVCLTIADTGCGIEPQMLARIFEPFFTTKPLGEGTGMGLSMVFGIVKQNGGHIQVFSRPGEGTTFSLYFPAVSSAQFDSPEPASRVPRTVPTYSGKVLLAEDEDIVRDLLERLLDRMGFEVISARNGRAALELARPIKDELRLVITDVVMPEMNGRVLSEELLELRPDLPVLFLSGYPDEVIDSRSIAPRKIPFLQKPFASKQFIEKISELIEAK